MKKLIIFALLAISITAQAQKEVILPGSGKINVEKLNKKINLKMDISKLSLCELRVLKNAFAARQGYLFMDADLRSIYEMTSWYNDRMYERWESGDDNEISYTDAEKKFIEKIEAREKQLLKDNFKTQSGEIVNTDNVVNPFQLETFEAPLKTMLAKNGFAIVQDNYDQLFQIYENNDYHNFPSFVTTDLYLQAFHVYFDALLRIAEEKDLNDRVTSFCIKMKDQMTQIATTTNNPQLKKLANWNEAYFAVAIALIKNQPVTGVTDTDYLQAAKEEVGKVLAEDANYSEYLGYTATMFTYNLFRPRGHYTRTEQLGCYFRAMMWLQTVPFFADSPESLQCAALMAETIDNTPGLTDEYNKMVDPITYIMGEPDNVSLKEMAKIMKDNGVTLEMMMQSPEKHGLVEQKVIELSKQKTIIKPKHQLSSTYKVNLMPQRYMPDAEVLQEMVDADSPVTKRGTSKGLDYFAAMGNTVAERILVDELKEAENWEEFMPNLNRMKTRMKEINWNNTVTNYWVNTLAGLCNEDVNYPYFMNTNQWQKKNLNAALASWAEMKHDAILYAKQPMIAECGDGKPEEPIVMGYVEPNVKFWKTAITLINNTQQAFKRFGIENERIQYYTDQMKEYAEFLLAVSEKELKGEKLDESDYYQIEIIGSNFEYLSLDMISKDNEYTPGWDYVEGADKKIALVADVLTSNGRNNPEKSVLYEAVGPAHQIYVIVEINGMLYLTRGAVFSYREFVRDVNDPRMTDEEWQKKLETYPNEGTPEWMKEIVIPNKDMPQDNEKVFYSTGC